MARLNADDAVRMAQIRAIEAEILRPSSPIPDDPFQKFPKNFVRAATISDEEWEARSSAQPSHMSDLVSSRQHRRRLRQSTRNVGRSREERIDEMAVADGRRSRQVRESSPRARSPQERRRPLSPTQLPGVRAIPKEYNHHFRGLLTPGEFFAKSHTRYLGPFDDRPTAADVPADDNYIILQRMGRLPESGKSIFRQVGTLIT